MSTATRDALLEQVRGFALILVVVGHALGGDPAIQAWIISPPWATALGAWIYSFHMPLFVACAGAAQSLSRARPGGDPWAPFLERRALRLLVPFVLAAILLHAPAAMLVQPGTSWGSESLRLLSGVGGGHLWFLWMLFCVQCLYRILISANVLPVLHWTVLAVASVGSLARGKFGWPDFLEWNHILRFLPWYAVGCLMPRFLDLARRWIADGAPWRLAGALIGLWGAHTLLRYVVDLLPNRGNPALTVLSHFGKESAALVGGAGSVLVVAILVARLPGFSRALSSIDRRGMWIYLGHGPIQWLLAPFVAYSGLPPQIYPAMAAVVGGLTPVLFQEGYHSLSPTSARRKGE